MTNAAADPLIGLVIENRFEIVSLIGRGGMSDVYKARHLQVELTVAVKVLKKEFVSVGNTLERFKREARTVNSFFHPNIISMYSFGSLESGEAYLVLDYLEGESLADLIKKEGGVNPLRSARIFEQICRGVAHAHEGGVLHRDLKPANIMLLASEQETDLVKILDFGIAKYLPGSGDAQQLTAAGEVFGSPLYMSPEQCLGKPLDERSDVYSLGCLMYETLSGVVPLRGPNVMATMMKHLRDQPRRLQEVRPGLQVPEKLEQVVFKTLRKDPDERYQNMMDVEKDLAAIEP